MGERWKWHQKATADEAMAILSNMQAGDLDLSARLLPAFTDAQLGAKSSLRRELRKDVLSWAKERRILSSFRPDEAERIVLALIARYEARRSAPKMKEFAAKLFEQLKEVIVSMDGTSSSPIVLDSEDEDGALAATPTATPRATPKATATSKAKATPTAKATAKATTSKAKATATSKASKAKAATSEARATLPSDATIEALNRKVYEYTVALQQKYFDGVKANGGKISQQEEERWKAKVELSDPSCTEMQEDEQVSALAEIFRVPIVVFESSESIGDELDYTIAWPTGDWNHDADPIVMSNLENVHFSAMVVRDERREEMREAFRHLVREELRQRSLPPASA